LNGEIIKTKGLKERIFSFAKINQLTYAGISFIPCAFDRYDLP
jgi:hypothetical protein